MLDWRLGKMKRAMNQSPALKGGVSATMSKLFAIFVLCLAVSALSLAQDPLSPSYLPAIDTNPADYPSNIWVTDTMQKIRQQSTVTPGTQHWGTFYGSQGEFVDFQVHVTAPGGGYSALSISTSSFVQTSPNSFTIPAPSTSNNNIVVYREAYVSIPAGQLSEPPSTPQAAYYGVAGYYPDPMIPAIDPYYHQITNAWPFNEPAGYNQSAWIDIFIPQNAPSGYYLGSVAVSNGGTTLATLPIIIGVWQWPAAQGGHMPSTSSLPTETQFGWADFCIANYGSSACGTYPGGLNQADTDGAVMFMDHRWTVSDPLNCSGAQCTSYFSGAAKTGANTIIPGATVTGQNDRGGPWSAPPGGLQAFATYFGANKYPSGSTGAYPKVTPLWYTSDEPGTSPGAWTSLCSSATSAHATSPPVATMATTYIQAMNANSGTAGCTTQGVMNSLDILVTSIPTLDVNGHNGNAVGLAQSTVGYLGSSYTAWLTHVNPDGIKPMWWSYIACNSTGSCGGQGYANQNFNYPNYNADAVPASNRASEWLVYLHGQVGELYYYATGCLNASCDPWTGALYQFGQQGDGWTMYPSTVAGNHHVTQQNGSPLTTELWLPRMTLKHMRDGMQDYEYMNALTVAGQGNYVTTQIQSWITNSYTFEFSGAGLQTARFKLGSALHQLTHTSVLLPPPTLNGTVQ
jgi:hypothetical protein